MGARQPRRDRAALNKVTFSHASEVVKDRGFTLADEYVPDAVAAVGQLRQHPAVDADRVFVLGHSLGGTVAPRVAVAEPAVAGLVILASGAEPMYWAAVRQFRYLDSLDPGRPGRAGHDRGPEPAGGQVDSPDLSLATPDSELPFGIPAPYWLDLRGYDPVAAAATLGQPMLIVQGGRDYQVTVPDDLARWEAGLAGRPDVTIRVYNADNHLSSPGPARRRRPNTSRPARGPRGRRRHRRLAVPYRAVR